MLHKLDPWPKYLETDTCWAFYKLKPKAAYVSFSNFSFSDHLPPTMCKISSIIAFQSILVIPLHIKINKNALKHKKLLNLNTYTTLVAKLNAQYDDYS